MWACPAVHRLQEQRQLPGVPRVIRAQPDAAGLEAPTHVDHKELVLFRRSRRNSESMKVQNWVLYTMMVHTAAGEGVHLLLRDTHVDGHVQHLLIGSLDAVPLQLVWPAVDLQRIMSAVKPNGEHGRPRSK